jgi:predicted NBD/HSP70 family sugar kinase
MTLTVAVEVGTQQVRALLLDPFEETADDLPKVRGAAARAVDVNRTTVDTDLVQIVAELVEEAAGDDHAAVGAVGVSCAAAVDLFGKIHLAREHTSHFHDFRKPLFQRLSAKFGNDLLLAVSNRSVMAAYGEFHYGHGRAESLTDMVFLSFGGTVGAGVIVDKQIVLGKHGFAGQFGHMLANSESNVVCDICHMRGCLSSVVGGTAILAELNLRKDDTGGKELISFVAANQTPPAADAGQRATINGQLVDAAAVVRAAAIDDGVTQAPSYPLAREIMVESVVPLASAIGQIISLLDPDILVLGGFLGSAEFLDIPLDAAVRDYVPVYRGHKLKVERTRFADFPQIFDGLYGDEAALFGAAHWVHDHRKIG